MTFLSVIHTILNKHFAFCILNKQNYVFPLQLGDQDQ